MAKRVVELQGPDVRGTVVNATVLRNLLQAVIEGSHRAIRLRTQGRSAARGPLPDWISGATEFDVEVKEGSTVLEFSAPTLFEADPDTFSQEDFFADIDPDRTSIDYFAETLEATMEGEERSDLYDRSLLRALKKDLEPVFRHGIRSLRIKGVPARTEPVELDREILESLQRLERSIPAPQRVRVAGKLNTIRHSDRTFSLVAGEDARKLKGSVAKSLLDRLQELWGEHVLVSGTAHFTASGEVQLVEADAIRSAVPKELDLWGTLPEPVEGGELRAAALREPQGPRSGLNAIVGSWPGDEDDEQVLTALEDLS